MSNGVPYHDSLFSPDYFSARRLFLSAATLVDAECQSFRLDHQSCPEGHDLFMDYAVVGPRDAPNVILITSGVHGVEGYCGSASQSAILSSKNLLQHLGKETAIVLVHAVNPYGFAHLRRWNEDNVDINRNFVDFSSDLPRNEIYEREHARILAATRYEDEDLDLASPSHHDRWRAWMDDGLVARITLGQHTVPNGLFYGGKKASWSNKVLSEIVHSTLARARRVVVLDLHSGIGEHGRRSLLYMPGMQDERLQQSIATFRDPVIDPRDPETPGHLVNGEVVNALSGIDAHVDLLAPLTLEFGTYPTSHLMEALVSEQNAFLNERRVSPEICKKAKRRLRDAYCCENTLWKRMVIDGAFEVTKQALEALNAA